MFLFIFQVFANDVDQDNVILLGARASRIENQDAIDACIVGMLADPKEVMLQLRHANTLTSLLTSEGTNMLCFLTLNFLKNWADKKEKD
jgi:hypothetical protein